MARRYRVIRSVEPYVYGDIQLEFQTSHPELSVREFKLAIISALSSLHGDVGVAIPVDVLKYRESDCRAYIRTTAKDVVMFRSALTLFSSWNNQVCQFRIYKLCHSLSSLAIESQHQNHLIIESFH